MDLDFGDCSICCSSMTSPSTSSFLACGHMFHPRCINQWFFTCKLRTCPVCRMVGVRTIPFLIRAPPFEYGGKLLLKCASFDDYMLCVGKQLFKYFPFKMFKTCCPRKFHMLALRSVQQARTLLEKNNTTYGYFLIRRAAHILSCIMFSDTILVFLRNYEHAYRTLVIRTDRLRTAYEKSLHARFDKYKMIQINFCKPLLKAYAEFESNADNFTFNLSTKQ